ncbi:TPA: helix-turn-helix domain-containing protein [Escherichia coli]|nr:XRE family transcriptional regulator [Escherichia coli]
MIELPDNLRGRMARLIERLEQEGNKMKIPHSCVIGGGLFELIVGDKNIARVEMLYEMREKAGLTKSALAERMGLRSSAISRLESNPLGASMKTLTRYAQACGATIDIHAVY